MVDGGGIGDVEPIATYADGDGIRLDLKTPAGVVGGPQNRE
jgi:hypothetical protein